MRTDSVEGKKGGKTKEARVGNVGRRRAESRRAKRGGRKGRKREASGSARRSREAERVWGRVGGDESNERKKSSTKVRATIAKKGPRVEKRKSKVRRVDGCKREAETRVAVKVGASVNRGAWTNDSAEDIDDAHYKYKERSERERSNKRTGLRGDDVKSIGRGRRHERCNGDGERKVEGGCVERLRPSASQLEDVRMDLTLTGKVRTVEWRPAMAGEMGTQRGKERQV
ncbi:hypothetical protein EDB85DRAFT_2254597 [Lactarius pseudohatsudake]|nr:hypothetical protein EDB85DRAFT_2254597 [Lactarius pseudohatsudake]